MGKVTQQDLIAFAEALGLEYDADWKELDGHIKRELAPASLYNAEDAFDDMNVLHDRIQGQKGNINALRKDFEALLDYLGLELNNVPKQKVIQKKAKK